MNHKPLKFVHITKTGGTSIEEDGFAAGILWGRHDPFFSAIGSWHRPLDTLDENQLQTLTDYELFTVVRNPFERCVSEFYCGFGGPGQKDVSVADFNRIIRDAIRSLEVDGRSFDHHWQRQKRYVFSGTDQLVKHVLRFEKLKTDFDALMEEHCLPIRLTRHENKSEKKFSVDHLDSETRELIRRFYADDFALFGYV